MPQKNDHTFAICAYRESPYLEECILSLRNQTLKTNIIITTSTPNEHISSLGKKYSIPVYVNPVKKGIGSDWNYALDQVHTKYATIAHQDDVYLKNYSKKILKKFNDNPNGLMIFSGYNEIFNDMVIAQDINLKIKKILLIPILLNGSRRINKRLSLAFGDPICCPSITFNKMELGDFRFDESLSAGLDWEAWEYLSHRTVEDLDILKRFWPKGIAKVISKIYRISEKGNVK